MIDKGSVLKLITETEGVVYFKVMEKEGSAYRVIQICHVKNGTVNLKYRHKIYSSIYKSEIGRNYVEVDTAEVDQIRSLMQSKMLGDFQLLVDVFHHKFELL